MGVDDCLHNFMVFVIDAVQLLHAVAFALHAKDADQKSGFVHNFENAGIPRQTHQQRVKALIATWDIVYAIVYNQSEPGSLHATLRRHFALHRAQSELRS